MRRIPGFDEKKLGFSGFKKLMQRVEHEGNVKLVTVGLVDWVVLSDEPVLEEAVADASNGRTVAPEAASSSEPSVEAAEPASETRIESGAYATPSRNGRRKPFKAPVVLQQNQESLPAPADASTAAVTEVLEQDQESLAAPAETTSPVVIEAVTDALKELDLPKGPDDGQDAQRVADLIVMADTLEHREGISHVAFNFLVSEVCDALDQGLEARHEVITQHWGEMHSRNYVTRLLRSLGNGDIFQRGSHTGKNKDTGRSTRRSTFNLNRNHPLVQKVLQLQWNVPESNGTPLDLEPSHPPSESDNAPLLEPSEGVSLLTEEQAPEDGPTPASGIGRVMRLFSRS
jgi:hypothetical protein